MKIFVTGGTGFLGSRLLPKLKAEGHEVLALTRSQSKKTELEKSGYSVVQGSLSNLEDWISELSEVDAVIHAAAVVSSWDKWRNYYEQNTKATLDLYEAASRARVKRFIFVSSESVLQDREPLLDIDESQPYPKEPNSYYGKSKMLAEKGLLQSNSSTEIIILRPTFIWGKGGPVIEEIARKIDSGQFMWVDGGDVPFEAVHVDNVVEALRLALTKGRNRGIYLVTDGEKSNAKEFMSKLLKTSGIEAPNKSISSSLVKPLAALLERIWRFLHLPGNPPLNRFEVAFLAQPRQYNISKIQTELGYRPVTNREKGFRQMEP